MTATASRDEASRLPTGVRIGYGSGSVATGAFGTVPGLQSRIMQYAGQAPTLASGANIGAFNVGNALGAWAGGIGIAAGLGYTAPIWIGAGITVAALVVMGIAMATAKARSTASVSIAPELAHAN